jgi:2-haloacid dehalogenase
MPLDYGRFDAITFDCYGTLIDWEAGLVAALQAALGDGPGGLESDALLERYAAHEARLAAGPYLRYRDVLAGGLRGVADELGLEAPSEAAAEVFGGSVVAWPAFADSGAALATLAGRFRLGVLTNCDDDLFAASAARLGIDFDWVVTAQQVGSYKPAVANFEALFARVGLPQDRILHVAQSLYHDHAPAKSLGMTTVWINRRHDRPGSGATPPAQAVPDAVFPDMASFASAATG